MSNLLEICHNDDSEVCITDEFLQTLELSDIQDMFGCGKKNVKFYIDRTLGFEEALIILEKLEKLALEDGIISIYTSGRNFNELMKAIKLRKSNIYHEMHIDDNDIRNILDVNNIICGLNFSRIACDCYFSDRYLVNFNPGDYIRLSSFPECKFDRKRIDKMRSVVENVWCELVPSLYTAYSLPGIAKVEMVLDYIEKRISTTDSFRENRFNNVEEYSRRDSQVDPSDDVVSVFRESVGTVLGKTRLAALLLDNYFAQVDCRVVYGDVFSVAENCSWLVTRHGGKKYGHSFEKYNGGRFSDLESLGYINGTTLLDDSHQYRSDYSVFVDGYSELDEISYFNLKSSLDNVRSTFIFPPKISDISLVDAESYYHDVNPKGKSKFPWLRCNFSVKSAPRKIVDNAHVKRKLPDKIYKRYQ